MFLKQYSENPTRKTPKRKVVIKKASRHVLKSGNFDVEDHCQDIRLLSRKTRPGDKRRQFA